MGPIVLSYVAFPSICFADFVAFGFKTVGQTPDWAHLHHVFRLPLLDRPLPRVFSPFGSCFWTFLLSRQRRRAMTQLLRSFPRPVSCLHDITADIKAARRQRSGINISFHEPKYK